MTIKVYDELVQGSDEWFALRCGILTASEMSKIITPTLKIADNDDTRSHIYELAAQRISQYVEPSYVSEDMLRGNFEEGLARQAYAEKYGEVKEVGFITNDKFGFKIGYSPDGLVGDDGLIECKSRKQKYQIETILAKGMPENKKINCMIQVQTGLLVSEKKWCDFVSYHGGLPMVTYRIYPMLEIQEAILRAATAFEQKLQEKMNEYNSCLTSSEMRLIQTERVVQTAKEMVVYDEQQD